MTPGRVSRSLQRGASTSCDGWDLDHEVPTRPECDAKQHNARGATAVWSCSAMMAQFRVMALTFVP